MVGSNSATSSKRRSFPWITRNKGKAEKACFCKLQSPDGRRRYPRRGSKTPTMLRASAQFELDDSIHTWSTSTSSSAEFSLEFSLPSDCQEFTLNSVAEASRASSAPPMKTNWKQLSAMERQQQSMSLLTSALAIATLEDGTEGDF